jgi:hypothetical protein
MSTLPQDSRKVLSMQEHNKTHADSVIISLTCQTCAQPTDDDTVEACFCSHNVDWHAYACSRLGRSIPGRKLAGKPCQDHADYVHAWQAHLCDMLQAALLVSDQHQVTLALHRSGDLEHVEHVGAYATMFDLCCTVDNTPRSSAWANVTTGTSIKLTAALLAATGSIRRLVYGSNQCYSQRASSHQHGQA